MCVAQLEDGASAEMPTPSASISDAVQPEDGRELEHDTSSATSDKEADSGNGIPKVERSGREQSAVVQASHALSDRIKDGVASLVSELKSRRQTRAPTLALLDADKSVKAVAALNRLADSEPEVYQSLLLPGTILLMENGVKARLFNNIHSSVRLEWLRMEVKKQI
ncbi:hypothetical protein DFJ73DRAFT_806287 [Zopfochytrium polystomum]|nr:hypothetical protein DFJ73DRAFT_806287 [Zopfochytrium polystomum]